VDTVYKLGTDVKYKPKSGQIQQEISAYFETLYATWGPQHWWPAQSPFEVIVGTILTQNTAWTNVEKALTNLRSANALSLDAIRTTPIENLEQMVRPAGYFRQKTKRLKKFVAWLDERYDGSLDRMFARQSAELRDELLELNGIGPETADSILLYAGQHEIFVVDAYTRRIFDRHRLIRPSDKYDDIRVLVERALQEGGESSAVAVASPPSPAVEPGPGPAEEVLTPVVHTPSAMSEAPRSHVAQRYNEFHGLLVQVAKHYCQSRIARCEQCPLRIFLASGRPRGLSKRGKKHQGRTGKA
jgi:endonuclease III related protein